jgi:hypothetical protein
LQLLSFVVAKRAEAREMNQTWLAVTMMATGILSQAQVCDPSASMLTVFTDNKAAVPNSVLASAKIMAGKVLAGAGVAVMWAEQSRPHPQQDYCGEPLIVALDARAPARSLPRVLASTTLDEGAAVRIRVYYDHVFAFVSAYPDRSWLPQFLGHVLAHEIAHVLLADARHSKQGVMTAIWDERQCAEMTKGPLPFGTGEIARIKAHFHPRASR